MLSISKELFILRLHAYTSPFPWYTIRIGPTPFVSLRMDTLGPSAMIDPGLEEKVPACALIGGLLRAAALPAVVVAGWSWGAAAALLAVGGVKMSSGFDADTCTAAFCTAALSGLQVPHRTQPSCSKSATGMLSDQSFFRLQHKAQQCSALVHQFYGTTLTKQGSLMRQQ